MFAASDDITELLRDPAALDRSWRSMAWALVLSLALHLGIAGPLLYLLSQAAWGPAAPALSIELSKDERAPVSGNHEHESAQPQARTPAKPAVEPPKPSPEPLPVTTRAAQHAAKRIPVSASRPRASPAPAKTRAAETPVATAMAPATRAVGKTQPESSATGTARHEPDFHLVYAPRPVYPRVAQQLGLEGRVVLGIWVSADGVPDVVVVKESSGYDSLDESAMEGVRKWRFETGDSAGSLAGGWVTQPVSFRLE